MDTGTVIGFDPSPLHVARQMRDRLSYIMADECPVTVRMRTTSHCTDFHSFKVLWDTAAYKEDFAFSENLFRRLLLMRNTSSPPSDIQLRFILEYAKALSDVKVNIKELVRFLTIHHPGQSSTIELKVGSLGESRNVSITNLGYELLLHLTGLDLRIPTKYISTLGDRVPEIWIDGHGILVEMEHIPGITRQFVPEPRR